MIVGIDASNIREGGGLNHIVQIIDKYNFSNHNIKKIIIWGNSKVNFELKNKKILKKKIIF